MNKIFAIVGLCGSGKSEAANILKKKGYGYVRFGQVTIDEIKKRGLEVNELNERDVREEFRAKHGMAAYAILNQPKIDTLLENNHVIADGLYSWEEYLILNKKYGKDLVLIATYTTKSLRYERLSKRPERPLTEDLARSRDHSEIEKLKKGGPIAIADYLIKNDSSLVQLEENLNKVIDGILK